MNNNSQNTETLNLELETDCRNTIGHKNNEVIQNTDKLEEYYELLNRSNNWLDGESETYSVGSELYQVTGIGQEEDEPDEEHCHQCLSVLEDMIEELEVEDNTGCENTAGHKKKKVVINMEVEPLTFEYMCKYTVVKIVVMNLNHCNEKMKYKYFGFFDYLQELGSNNSLSGVSCISLYKLYGDYVHHIDEHLNRCVTLWSVLEFKNLLTDFFDIIDKEDESFWDMIIELKELT